MNKPKWNKPKLIVLIKNKDGQERVLQFCKNIEEFGPYPDGPIFTYEVCAAWPACAVGCSSNSTS